MKYPSEIPQTGNARDTKITYATFWVALESPGDKNMKDRFLYSLVAFLIVLLISCTPQQSQLPSVNRLSDDQLAQGVLVSFLDSLHGGKYAEAVQLYGGTYETMIDHNPGVNPDDRAVLLRYACTTNGMLCLQMKSVSLDKKVSDSEFIFKVEYLDEAGNLFMLGPCCGGEDENLPPQSQFYFTVEKTDDNRFVVMDMPPYSP